MERRKDVHAENPMVRPRSLAPCRWSHDLGHECVVIKSKTLTLSMQQSFLAKGVFAVTANFFAICWRSRPPILASIVALLGKSTMAVNWMLVYG